MHAVAAPARARSPAATPLGVGMIIWLASEVMFFAGLFAAYFVLAAENDVWPPAGVELEVPRTAVFTGVLLLSSVTMHLAVRASEQGRREMVARWLGATIVLGSLFVANQALEWATLDFEVSSHAYGSIFYVLTGFHGLHVIGGVVLMAAVAGVTLGRSSRAPLAPVMEVTGYYWHFVDVVWVGVFSTVYLLQ